MPKHLAQQYRALKKLASHHLAEGDVTTLLAEMALHARELLRAAAPMDLTSMVAGKHYFGFRAEAESRPINAGLYAADDTEFRRLLDVFASEGFRSTAPAETVRAVYTIAYSVFAANDCYKVGRKASATFFEILIGHTIARTLSIRPRKRVRMPESEAELPTDYVFDPGSQWRKIHLPIKTSTRERAVQAWVHQLVLDRIFGNGVYRGVLVVASETKRDTRTGQVIEILVPRQLQMFQSRVAEIARVYYLDPPQAYLSLSTAFPKIEVKSFGEALVELEAVLRQ